VTERAANTAGRAALACGLLSLAGVAWVATDVRMSGMDGGPGTDPGAIGFFISTWVVMMAAMMLPAITPAVISHRDLRVSQRNRRRGAPTTGSGPFVVGYLAVWAAAGLAGYALIEAGRGLAGGPLGWDHAGRGVAAGVLVTAALYQLTPYKRSCLDRCRTRHAPAPSAWREGRAGALRMGIEHGAWCLGCCWALMAALFALGAMSIGWMVVVSVLIAAERLLPWSVLSTAAVASLLAALAIGVAAAPARVPMLTIPGSPSAMGAMGAMPAVVTPSPMMHSQPSGMGGSSR
jgi:predicted metal-binding membrane protein